MKTGIKVLSIVCGILILIGIILSVMALIFGGFGNEKTKVVTLTAGEEFTKISIETGMSDVVIEKSDTNETYAMCDESKKIKYELKIENGTLFLSEIDNRKWYDYIGIHFGDRKTTLFLKADSYESLNIKTLSGSIDFDEEISFKDANVNAMSGSVKIESAAIDNLKASAMSGSVDIHRISAKSIEAEATSGGVYLTDLQIEDGISVTASSGGINIERAIVKSITASASSGNINLFDITASSALNLSAVSGNIKITDASSYEKAEIKTSSGNISFSGFDSQDIYIEASSGNVTGALLTGKLFDVRTTSGTSSYPDHFIEGGSCKIKTTSGNVKIEIEG